MRKIVRWPALLLAFFFAQAIYAQSEPPLSLTAADGSGIELRSLNAKIVQAGFLTFTELEMVFFNPEDRRREGRFQIVLPNGAAVSRFAMKIGEFLQEGEVVEKQKAQQAYEDFLHRRQDPALLESDTGNRFNARVFPIEPRSEKTIILSYSQRFEGGALEYVLPLKGLPKLKTLNIKVLFEAAEDKSVQAKGGFEGTASSRQVSGFEKTDFQPTEDFRINIAGQLTNNMALQSESLIAIRAIPFPKGNAGNSDPFKKLVLLVDQSASQAPHFSKTVDSLESLIETIKPSQLSLCTFDQTASCLGEANETKAQIQLIERLKGVEPLGASNLEAAFDELSKLNLDTARLVIVSDTAATAGAADAQSLATALKKLKWLERVDVISPSYYREAANADAFVKSGKRPGVAFELDDAKAAEEKLLSPVHGGVPISLSNSTWFWPETIDSLLPGQAVIIFAEVQGSPELKIDGQQVFFTKHTVNPILLKRETVRARIERLVAKEMASSDKDMKNAMHNEIINLSQKERILTTYTALLVLETEQDYRRFGIDRNALADIMTVGMDGIEIIKRAGREGFTPWQPPLPRVMEDRIGDGRVPQKSRQSGSDSFVLRDLEGAAPAEQEPRRDESDVAASVPIPAAREMEDIAAAPVRERRMAEDRLSATTSTVAQAPVAAAAEHRKDTKSAPYTGKYAEFRELLDKGKIDTALDLVLSWRHGNYADVMALIALGETFEAKSDRTNAERAYGSLIDYFPGRADIRRWAAERLLKVNPASVLAVDCLKKAVEQRPDHPSGHYLLAIAEWSAGLPRDAVETLLRAKDMTFNSRFLEANRILSETLNLMLAALKKEGVLAKLFPEKSFDSYSDTGRQLRFVLMWETDANDVDFHIYDAKQNHAFYSQKKLASGGELYADITQGYGPECFTVHDPQAGPYKLQAHYYNMGPMGYGMGLLHILEYTRDGQLRSEFRPFVVMQNQAFVELGTVK